MEQNTTPDAVLAAALELAPTIAARAAEIEATRRTPDDLLKDLIEAGCFRVLMPTSHHGVGADLAGGAEPVAAGVRPPLPGGRPIAS